MDFGLTDEQHAIRAVAQELFTPLSAALPGHRGVESDWFDTQAWTMLAKANLLGLWVSEEFGGSGLRLLDVCVLLVEQGRHLIRAPLVPSLAVATPAINQFGADALREWLLPRVVTGEAVLSAALTEPRAYDPFEVGTVAEIRPGGRWALRGEKTCVPHAGVAERIVTPFRMPDSRLATAVVEPSAEGVLLEAQHGTHGEPLYRMRLDGVLISEDDMLGKDADEREEAFRLIHQWATVGACAMQLGVVEQILALTTTHTSQRRQFGQPLASFQGVTLRLADAYLAVECIRNSMWQAAWALSTGREAAQEVRTAKYWASEGAQKVAAIGQYLHGGVGVDIDYPLHRYTLWSKSQELILVSTHPVLAAIGRRLAEGDNWSEGHHPDRNRPVPSGSGPS